MCASCIMPIKNATLPKEVLARMPHNIPPVTAVGLLFSKCSVKANLRLANSLSTAGMKLAHLGRSDVCESFHDLGLKLLNILKEETSSVCRLLSTKEAAQSLHLQLNA